MLAAMDVETAIRTRRTHKAFGSEPLSREEIGELLELARWAPNHNLTAPWRFRVVGPQTLARLKEAAGPEGAPKLERAPTLIVVSCALGGYWRTPELLRTEEGREAVGLPKGERFVALLHLGQPRQEKAPPQRPPL